MAQLPELCTASSAADILNVSRETIYRWAREGLIQVINLPGGTKRFRRADIEALLEPSTTTPRAS